MTHLFSGQPETVLLFAFAWIPAAAEVLDVGADAAGKQVSVQFQALIGRGNLCFPPLPHLLLPP